VIRVYAVCDRPEVPPPEPLDAVRAGDVLAVFGPHVPPQEGAAADALWEYERVVEELMAERTVLPMRFGTVLPDAGALREAVAARHDAFAERLAFVRGRVELGVRAIGTTTAPAPSPDASGREYLLARLGSDHAAAELHEPLAARAVASSRHPDGGGEILRAAYLVDRDDVASFVGAVERLRGEHPDVAMLCTGPWPPYSFVSDPTPRSLA
jgi:hypothetical protein